MISRKKPAAKKTATTKKKTVVKKSPSKAPTKKTQAKAPRTRVPRLTIDGVRNVIREELATFFAPKPDPAVPETVTTTKRARKPNGNVVDGTFEVVDSTAIPSVTSDAAEESPIAACYN